MRRRSPGRLRVIAGAAMAALVLGALLAGAAGAQTELVAKGAVWRYDTGTDLGTAWKDPGYDDSGWASGSAILGYGETYITTTVPYGPDPNNKYPTAYFRISFTYSGDPASLLGFVLHATYDDGFAAYLNGQEVARSLLAAGAPYAAYSTGSHEGGAYEAFDLLAYTGDLVAGTNTLAVEVHQRAGNSSDLVMDMELTASTGVDVVRGPYLQVGTATSGIVRWRTSVPTTSCVHYGSAPGVWEGAVESTASVTDHEMTVSGLSPSTTYYYAVGTTTTVLEGGTADYRFTTSPPPGTGKATRAWIIGDSGTANANAASVRIAYENYTGTRGTDLWLMLGDNAYSAGTDAQYQAAVFDMYPVLLRQCFLWPTRGNHDQLYSGAGNDYYDIFTLPAAGEAGGVPSGTEAYYSFDYGTIHFVCLDSEGSDRSPGGAMLTWLAADLAAATQYWIVAFWHHPPYTKGSHDSDDPSDSGGRMRDMRENALPILEAGGVDLVLTGHSHAYERSFLIDGHYDVSSTLTPGMIVDGGDGRVSGNGAYVKPTWGQGPHEGSVYVVAGSSGQTSGGSLDHPVMFVSFNLLGSVVLDVDGTTLHAVFVDNGGTQRDDFTIEKGSVSGTVPDAGVLPSLVLSPARPNPFAAETRLAFSLPEDGPVRLSVYDVAGHRIRVLVEAVLPQGEHHAAWDGTDGAGRPAAPGVYFGVLEAFGERRVRKLALAR